MWLVEMCPRVIADTPRRPPPHIFFSFIACIFMALLMCVEQPGMSFCDIDDFAAVISCIAAVLLSPSGIFMTAASALAMPSAEQAAVFDLARAGAAASAMAARAAQAVLKIMLVPRNRSRPHCRSGETSLADAGSVIGRGRPNPT